MIRPFLPRALASPRASRVGFATLLREPLDPSLRSTLNLPGTRRNEVVPGPSAGTGSTHAYSAQGVSRPRSGRRGPGRWVRRFPRCGHWSTRRSTPSARWPSTAHSSYPRWPSRGWTTRDAGSSTSRCRRAPPTSAAEGRRRPGDSTGTTWARRCGPSEARRSRSTSPTSSTRRPPCTGTACTFPRNGRRAAPADRPGRHVVAVVAHRPACVDAVVPPPPARQDLRARLPRAGRDVHRR